MYVYLFGMSAYECICVSVCSYTGQSLDCLSNKHHLRFFQVSGLHCVQQYKTSNMADEIKKNRSKLKGMVTRRIKSIKKFKSLGQPDKVKAEMEQLIKVFEDFETTHESYHDTLQTEEAWDESDQYFDTVHENFISTIDSTKLWLGERSEGEQDKKDSVKAENGGVNSSSGGATGTRELLQLVNHPKIEIEKFAGDPTKFHTFMMTFDEVVGKTSLDDPTKLTHLFSATEGDAKNAIRGCILVEGGKGYAMAREILVNRFGNDHLVMERLIDDLRHGGPVRSAKELQQLADDLQCCFMTLSQMGHLQEVDNQGCVVEIVCRLQMFLQNRWKKMALESKNKSKRYPGFKELVDFVIREAGDANDPVYGKLGHKVKGDAKCKSDSVSKQSTSFSSTVNDSGSRWKRPPCSLCSSDHKLLYCYRFRAMKPCERLRYVHDHKLCENCLLSNHSTENCRKVSVCDIPGCGKKHTRYIHVDPPSPEKKEGIKKGRHVEANNIDVEAEVHMPIVNLKVNDTYHVRALLDSASSSTFCSRKLVDDLGLKGSCTEYVLNTLGNSEEKMSEIVSFEVSSEDDRESLYLPHVYVVDRIPVRSAPIDCQSFPHLRDLPLLKESAGVEILIGQDNAEALVPLEVRKGSRREPFAVKTMFGWSLNGPAKTLPPVKQSVISHFVHADSLEEKVNSLWKIENEGISDEVSSMSVNDKKVLQLWDNSCRKVDCHYELPIPWKSNVQLSNNITVALSRLKSLKMSLAKRGLASNYDQEMRLLLSKGYAEVVPPDEVNMEGRVWYLPHHAVVSDKKPGKTRIVFDCAAQFKGESLNSNCLRGPDQNNRLVNVMIRFRQHPIAIMADIEGMYHQVLIPVADRNALRYLWYDDEGHICHFRMTRHLFGGVWCSSSSTYALRRILFDHPDTSPLVADTILRSFYVDDCLRSVVSLEEAETVVFGTKSLLSAGGFNLTKFVTNDLQLLSMIPESERAKEVKEFSSDCQSKALGVKWDVIRDVLSFGVSARSTDVVTRRHMLAFVASIFDPLGLVSPVVIIGKLLFQQATRLKLPWDSEVPEELKGQWEAWLETLRMVVKFEVPRCIKPVGFEDAFLELHNFSDASQRGYGCCTYLRCVDRSGRISVSLVLSKSKVAPLKQVTIPRLELEAAVLAAKVDNMLRSELDLQLGPSYFWVDSEIVLKYIQNEDRKFHVFVANRIGMIRELTSVGQWHHISGKENPADRVSRGQDVQHFNEKEWLGGPSFLGKFKSEWNVDPVSSPLSDDDPEVKSVSKQTSKLCFLSDVEPDPLEKLFEYHSSWYKLKKAVAWLLRFRKFLQSKKVLKDTGKPLMVSDLDLAESAILKYVPELQRRAKWLKIQQNVKIGDFVLIASENTPRSVWPMGIVKDVYPGSDGLIRSVKVKTKVTELVRPIVKIVLLEGSM